MENCCIKDSQITASSVHKDSNGRATLYPWLARLNKNDSPSGGWCPEYKGGKKKSEKNYDQYIQIDLLNLTKITGIATQGRDFLGKGAEYTKDYKISHSRDGEKWNFYGGKTVKVNLIEILK